MIAWLELRFGNPGPDPCVVEATDRIKEAAERLKRALRDEADEEEKRIGTR